MHLQKLQQDTVLASFSWTHSLFQPRSLPREHTGAAYPEEGLLTIWDTHRANLPMAFTEHTHGGTDFWEEGLKKKSHLSAPSVHKEPIFTVQQTHCTPPNCYQAPLTSEETPRSPTVTFRKPYALNRPSAAGAGEPTRTRGHLMAGQPPAPLLTGAWCHHYPKPGCPNLVVFSPQQEPTQPDSGRRRKTG